MRTTVMNGFGADERLPVALAAAAATAILLMAPAAAATGQVGEPAADFSLYDTDNNFVRLQHTSGEVRFLFMVGYG